MKTVTVRLPDRLIAEIESEARRRKLSKSEVVRERLTSGARFSRSPAKSFDSIADLVGSVEGLPRNLSGQKNKYLKSTNYGRNRLR
jgi:hypothetical protein